MLRYVVRARCRRAFLLWEAAVELRHAYDCASDEWETSRGWEAGKEKVSSVRKQQAREEKSLVVVIDSSDEDKGGRGKESLSSSSSSSLTKGGKPEGASGNVDDFLGLPERTAAELGIYHMFFGGGISTCDDQGISKWQQSSTESIEVIRLSLVAVAATRCYLASKADAASELAPPTRTLVKPAAAGGVGRLPPWLEHMGPLAVLVSVASGGIRPLEQLGRFAEACQLLRWLLETTAAAGAEGSAVSGHRRGEWHLRLAIDLKHLQPKVTKSGSKRATQAKSLVKQPSESTTAELVESSEDALRSVLLEARADPWVRGGDRLDVLRRLQRLGGGGGAVQGWVESSVTKVAAAAVVSTGTSLATTHTALCSEDSSDEYDFESSRQTKRAPPSGDDRASKKKRKGKTGTAVTVFVSTESKKSVVQQRPCTADVAADKEARGIGWDAGLIEGWLSEGGASLVSLHYERLRWCSAAAGSPPELGCASSVFPSEARLCAAPPVDVVVSRRLNSEVGVKSRFVGLCEFEEACSVEELALQFYALQPAADESKGTGSLAPSGGWSGIHCEGGPLRELFSLLMWPALFAPVPDVFQTPFQLAPLDLDCPSTIDPVPAAGRPAAAQRGPSRHGFYAARAATVEDLLAELAGLSPQGLSDRVASAFVEHEGVSVRGMDWRRHTPLGLLQVSTDYYPLRQAAAPVHVFLLVRFSLENNDYCLAAPAASLTCAPSPCGLPLAGHGGVRGRGRARGGLPRSRGRLPPLPRRSA